jgi:hypothetical protein
MAQLQSTSITGSLIVTGGITGSFSGSIVAPGSTTQVLYNNSGVISANSGFVYSGSNVGIGTTSPSTKLALAGSTATTFGLSLEPSGWNNAKHRFSVPISGDVSMWSFNWNGSAVDSALYAPASILLAQGTITFNTTGSANSPAPRMIINSVGDVGIGTTSPAYKLSIQGSAGIEASEEYFYFNSTYSVGNNARGKIRAVGAGGGSGYGGDLRFSSRASNNVWNEDVMTIANTGYVGIGTTTPAYLLDVNGTARVTTLIETSALKYKTNIQPLESQLSKILQLQPVTFDWIDKPNPKTNIGLIAHEVEKIYPEFVSKTKNGEIEGIEYSKLTAVLIQSIKDLKEIVDKQQEQINTLLKK